MSGEFMPEKKPFSKKLYERSDYKSKIFAKNFFIKTGVCVDVEIPKSELFKKGDLLLYYRPKGIAVPIRMGVEVEHKLVWDTSGDWISNWSTVTIPYRKFENTADLFIMFNRFWDTLLLLNMRQIKSSEVIQKKTKYTASGTEKFFNVPISKFLMFYTIDEWDTFKRINV